METIKKVYNLLAPKPQKAKDGRDKFPNRASYILASVGGVVGLGNMLRYPSQVYNNAGLQWFVPYLIANVLLALPTLALETSFGNAYRGGTTVAFNNVHSRLKGTGLAFAYVCLAVTSYFVVILAWIMVYFRFSFQSPLPWMGEGEDFYMDSAVRAVPGDEPSDGGWIQYSGTSFVPELVGWTALIFFVVWLCMFRGVGLTGRVVYITMGLPIILVIILIGRCCSLPNAGEGVRLYFGSWDSAKLATSSIWTDAVGQVFFSTGVGFGFFLVYASYNQQYANAVQDAMIIVGSNVTFEVFLAFAVFGVVGFLRLWPEEFGTIGSYAIGFYTYPMGIAEMPGANFWAVLFFFTVMLVGISSSFAMLDCTVAAFTDSERGRKMSHSVIVTMVVFTCFLLALPYCTQFGFYYMDGIDRWSSNLGLVYLGWAESTGATSLYRYRDVIGQVGLKSYLIFNAGLVGAQFLGTLVAHVAVPGAGAGVGFGWFFALSGAAVLVAKTPDTPGGPKFWNRSPTSQKVYYLAFYQGNQLRNDLNLHVGQCKNWKLPVVWAPLLRFITAPMMAIVLSLSYAGFGSVSNDPMHVFGFIAAHTIPVLVLTGLAAPRWFDPLIPIERRDDGNPMYAPNVMRGTTDARVADITEAGSLGEHMKRAAAYGDKVSDTASGDEQGAKLSEAAADAR